MKRFKHSAVFLAALVLATAGCRREDTPPSPQGPMNLCIPEQGAYTGAFIDFGDNEDEVTLERIEDFEALIGKHQAIIASSSYWGEQSFPTANMELIRRHGSVPLVFWSPWDRAYQEDMGPDKFSLDAIAAGKWDDYIDRWADSARQFGYPIMVSFANEMNGGWFPWSGCFYGGGAIVPGTGTAQNHEIRYEGPETFKKAYRHVVDRVRARSATNVLWVFHAMNYSSTQDSWNTLAQYYPGAAYVDWLGFSVYGEQYSDDPWSPFAPLLDWPYQELCALDPIKPVIIAEWGIGEFPTRGSKPAFIAEAFEDLRTRYPRLKAAVFWNERWQNDDLTYSNLRVNSSPESLAAYRHGVAEPFWLDSPVLAPQTSTHSPQRTGRK